MPPPLCPGSRPFDDEGVATRCTALIEKGIPVAFYYDLQTAGLANTKSTGNGARSGARLPSPSASVFVTESGTTSFKEMLSDIKEGLVIEYVMGAEQGNVLGGDLSNVLLGYKIDNGKITGRVKNTMVSGNVTGIKGYCRHRKRFKMDWGLVQHAFSLYTCYRYLQK